MYFIILHYFLAFYLNIFRILEKENEFSAGGPAFSPQQQCVLQHTRLSLYSSSLSLSRVCVFIVQLTARAILTLFWVNPQQVASEPESGGRSIVARYRHWNRDCAIKWVMARGKGDDDGVSGAKEGTMVVQRVVHEMGGGWAFLVLTKNNYSDWALLMRVKLKACGL
jgi:hypothetical protein